MPNHSDAKQRHARYHSPDTGAERVTVVRDFASEPSDDAYSEQRHSLLTVGSLVGGKYTIDGELGRGGMGAVFRAHHVDLLKPVALKMLLPELASDPSSQKRFSREARAASNIKHDNVVDVYDFGIDAERGIPFLVMELLTGLPLRIYLQQRRQLDWREALGIMLPCMRGVAAAHKHGIVHRDLKPENIFLCESDDPDSRRVKVLDFGVAAALGAGSDDKLSVVITRSESCSVVGTIYYMPPEQLAGAMVDVRADVYALGVILYEMTAGRRPYSGDTTSGVSSAILEGKAPPLCSISGVDSMLSGLVQRAMARNVADRFADVTAMMQAFQQYARQQRERHSLRSALVRATMPTEPSMFPAAAVLTRRKRHWAWLALGGSVLVLCSMFVWKLAECGPTLRLEKPAVLVAPNETQPLQPEADSVAASAANDPPERGLSAHTDNIVQPASLKPADAVRPRAVSREAVRRAHVTAHASEPPPPSPVAAQPNHSVELKPGLQASSEPPERSTATNAASGPLMKLRPNYESPWH